MWPALIPLALALMLLISGGRSIWRDCEERRFGWAALGCLTTLAGIAALVLFAHLWAATAADFG
jgi:hypothetical protein